MDVHLQSSTNSQPSNRNPSAEEPTEGEVGAERLKERVEHLKKDLLEIRSQALQLSTARISGARQSLPAHKPCSGR
ncbi:hypothetical protein CALVIDRAFT_541847 [Calocera viscosa TUFC12733]|uniref:Uncharacterized protein n=1 Tax=Calocera viscosa (strain TUFC12733) TaxID=1330018 RepID=A0A167HB94_CALVF|nr:hypothetical protein CALVIDRAFT_541847 [Calocera viscosa TUFC12733]